MAGNVQISVKDKESANAWLMKVMTINEDYHSAMIDAGDALVDMQNFADGTVVDELVAVGDGIIGAANETFKAINTIADTVNTILGSVGDFVSTVTGWLGTVGNIFGA